LLTGVFAKDGLLDGHAQLLLNQLIAVVATMAYCAVMTFMLVKVVDAVFGLRVSEEEEENGLDLTQHGEQGYVFPLKSTG
jgi:Amt family ammonium transporter